MREVELSRPPAPPRVIDAGRMPGRFYDIASEHGSSLRTIAAEPRGSRCRVNIDVASKPDSLGLLERGCQRAKVCIEQRRMLAGLDTPCSGP